MQCLRSLPRAARAPTTTLTRPFSTTTPRPLAKMQLIGNLTDAPEEFATSTGRNIIRYVVAVNGPPKDEEGNLTTSYFKVGAFLPEGPSRDYLLRLPKGAKIFVEAEAKMDKYQGTGGESRVALNLIQRSFESLSNREELDSKRERQGSGSVTGPESDTNAAEEPQSGLGAS